MADESASAAGSPASLFAMLQGASTAAALKAGIDLEIFTHIAHGANTADKIAAEKKLPVRSTRILCDALVAFGALAKSDGHYANTPAAQMLLVKGSPVYAGAMASVTANPLIWQELARLTDVIRAGHTLLGNRSGEAEDNPFWQDFARGSRAMAQLAGPALADTIVEKLPGKKLRRILDIACGSGYYGFTALKRFPDARLVSVDWPGVLKHTEANAHQAGVANRVEFRPADIFSGDLGAGYDLILAVNICHHFSADKNTELFRRLFAAGAPGANLVVVDMIPDEGREQERFALAFALTMLIWTRDGDTYTLSEYRKMLEAARFRDVRQAQVGGLTQSQAVIAAK